VSLSGYYHDNAQAYAVGGLEWEDSEGIHRGDASTKAGIKDNFYFNTIRVEGGMNNKLTFEGSDNVVKGTYSSTITIIDYTTPHDKVVRDGDFLLFALHLNTFSYAESNSIKGAANVDATDVIKFHVELLPVPEPQNYIMLLAGLGLLVFFARYSPVGLPKKAQH